MLPEKKILNNFSFIITIVLFAIGVSAFVAYWLNSFVKYRIPGLIGTNPVTALSFVLTGMWLLYYQRLPKVARSLHPYVVSIVIICSAFKILEYTELSNINFDRWFFYGLMNSDEYFRPLAPNSTFLLVLSGSVVLLSYKKSVTARLCSDIFRITGFLVAYMAILGYIYKLEIAYRVAGFMPLAFNSAIGYMIFFTASLITLPAGKIMRVIGSRHIGGKMARSAIPLILLIVLLFGAVEIISEMDAVPNKVYGTALETSFMVLLLLVFVFIYAKRLNHQDKIRSQAEIMTIESEKKYRTLVNTLREGVIYYDNNGIISFCNSSFLSLTGYKEHEVIGKSIFELFIDEELRDKYRKRMLQNRAGNSEVYEENLKTRDGQSLWVSISISPVFNEEGETIAALSTIVDISERKKQIEDIEAFSASAAHDLNAPLARIEMIALLLIDSTESQLDEENVELLKAIAGITANMRALLKDLLQFSKLGVTGVSKKETDTEALVKEVVLANRHINPRATIKIEFLPELKADKTMLKQVFTNLISNALKYSSLVDQPEVIVGSYDEGGKTVVYVKDNGAGFDMADAAKLFAAFQRLHVEFEGNGMGLPIVKRIIEKHGGRIWAFSKPKEGATFYFTIS